MSKKITLKKDRKPALSGVAAAHKKISQIVGPTPLLPLPQSQPELMRQNLQSTGLKPQSRMKPLKLV